MYFTYVVSNCYEINATPTVSVKSTVSISMPLSTVAQPSRFTAMTRCVPQWPTPASTATKKPPVLFSGYNLNNCTITFSGNPSGGGEYQSRSSPSDVDTTKFFEGISVDELYDD